MPGEGSQAADGTLSFEKVNPHKAPGPVGIPGGVLRACAPSSSTSEAATGNQQFHVAPTPDPSSHWPIEGREPHTLPSPTWNRGAHIVTSTISPLKL